MKTCLSAFLKNKKTKFGLSFNLLFFCRISFVSFAVFLVACGNESQKLDSVNGDVAVQIALPNQNLFNPDSQDSFTESSAGTSATIVGSTLSYKLQTVVLKNISQLKNLSGQYAQFYYSPGLANNQLTGQAPKTLFFKNKQNVFIPGNDISLQLATIYYHLQNLTRMAKSFGLTTFDVKPLSVGVQTIVADADFTMVNNAFYDGQIDSILFVPYSLNELPISVNAGIIAHEYFHRIFYKKIKYSLDKNSLTADQITGHKFPHHASEPVILDRTGLYNQTYLRGINEGFADFWGWVYSNDADFIKWSLSDYNADRTLSRSYSPVSQKSISVQVVTSLKLSKNPTEDLSEYIYQIGTPHASFLKELTLVRSRENSISLQKAKREVAQFLMGFLDGLTQQVAQNFRTSEIPANLLFTKMAESNFEKIGKEQCDLIAQYANFDTEANAVDAKTLRFYECRADQRGQYQVQVVIKSNGK